ncbi:MAG: HK97 gp10 family phage protein [Bacteroidota bacterium]|nr:HK97 gp10 family phage protein [Bacteroidota bacterium]
MENIKVDFKELEKFAKDLEKARDKEMKKLLEQITNEIASRLLRKVIKRTPVFQPIFGDELRYKSGKRKGELKYNKDGTIAKDGKRKIKYKKHGKTITKDYTRTGGNLRRSWDITKVGRSGNRYEVTVFNPIEYAVYVEYGHRQTPGRYVPAIGKKLKKSWVEGKFMLTKSELELKDKIPAIVEKKIEAWLKEVFG